jgi:hypothetical protein
MERATEAHRSAVICALIGLVGTFVGFAGFWQLGGSTMHGWLFAGLIVNCAALAILHARRESPSRALSNALFLIILVPAVANAWLLDQARADHSARWVPYEPNKLSMLTLAMIAPPGWATGLAGIGMFMGSALVHDRLISDAVRARMAAGEPYGIIAYGAFSIVLLGFKQRGHGMREELARARSEKLALERVARVAIALRDLANTPVQTLELVRHELMKDAPWLHVHQERMGRALAQLRKLNDVLMQYQNAVTWDVKGHAFEEELAPPPAATDGSGPADAARSRAPPAPRRPA